MSSAIRYSSLHQRSQRTCERILPVAGSADGIRPPHPLQGVFLTVCQSQKAGQCSGITSRCCAASIRETAAATGSTGRGKPASTVKAVGGVRRAAGAKPFAAVMQGPRSEREEASVLPVTRYDDG